MERMGAWRTGDTMSTLSARFIKKPRHTRGCEWCGRPITGPHILLYGAGESHERPYNIRLHPTEDCCPTPVRDTKIIAALDKAKAYETSKKDAHR